MIRDNYGRIEFNSLDIIKILYQNPDIDTATLPLSQKDLQKYTEACTLCNIQPKFQILEQLSLTVEDFDLENQNNWFIPKDNLDFDIEQWLIHQCQTNEEKSRVQEELDEYQKFNMVFLLKVSKYLVDTFRKNQIVWGVGRGSSVASYCLYLIGLHKVNSLKYNLDIHEFLK
jgi:DNA polymerase III alpha subunit